ncbi:hypothetical protein XAP412_410002 [Xanthomonas phaseoli pv. phaseoli]|uniref:Uncharacterized protein n=1 Tax=Xanthomonas campestris pv. phaseoli TaxID=317013 RepID=A0AB38E1N4_XANCH|nr:hypothetical protein XAP6984_460002 [Xanthomonas phaseoli pv. phaseoli]SON85171.1 hypothetical protein XAP412_410002 [Xanthomonas phaseoli pv. phaseoli]SON89681.1 hypothetical protein XAP7430_430002 [Xanthomonas phaseoli pv. phaseoli]
MIMYSVSLILRCVTAIALTALIFN